MIAVACVTPECLALERAHNHVLAMQGLLEKACAEPSIVPSLPGPRELRPELLQLFLRAPPLGDRLATAELRRRLGLNNHIALHHAMRNTRRSTTSIGSTNSLHGQLPCWTTPTAWSLIDDMTTSWARRLQASVSNVVASKFSCALDMSASLTWLSLRTSQGPTASMWQTRPRG